MKELGAEHVLAERPEVEEVVYVREGEAGRTHHFHMLHVGRHFADEQETAEALEERNTSVGHQNPVKVAPHVIAKHVHQEVDRLENSVQEEVRNADEDEVEVPPEVLLSFGPSRILPAGWTRQLVRDISGFVLDVLLSVHEVVFDAPNKLVHNLRVCTAIMKNLLAAVLRFMIDCQSV